MRCGSRNCSASRPTRRSISCCRRAAATACRACSIASTTPRSARARPGSPATATSRRSTSRTSRTAASASPRPRRATSAPSSRIRSPSSTSSASCSRATTPSRCRSTVRRARVEGRLWGGNLAMLVSLLGTPFMPRVRDGILFVEDVNEPAYKLERMFLQLAHAGVLQRQAAIVLGDFDPVTPMPNDNGYGLPDVIERLRKAGGVPVYSGLPFGHVPRKLTLPGRRPRAARRSSRRPRDARTLPLSVPRVVACAACAGRCQRLDVTRRGSGARARCRRRAPGSRRATRRVRARGSCAGRRASPAGRRTCRSPGSCGPRP